MLHWESMPGAGDALDELEAGAGSDEDRQDTSYEILFMDAEDTVLVKRYKETTKKSPAGYGQEEWMTGIRLEREKMKFLREACRLYY